MKKAVKKVTATKTKAKSVSKAKAKTTKTTLPSQMKAIEIQGHRLVLVNRAVPVPAAGEVLVKVRAAGVNRPDILQRKGLYPAPAGVTDIPGLEIAGDIIALGKGVTGLKKGQKVMALVAGGGYAEYCTVPVPQCLPIPANMTYIEAAAVPETFFTVWTNLFDRGCLKKGETILIHGGSSGIGTTAIQVAKAFGATVFATAGNDVKCAACKKLGAKLTINYKTQDFVEVVMAATKNHGVDVILDMVGGDYVTRNLKILAPHGRHVSIAMQKGRHADIDLFLVMSKRLVMTGSTLRPQPVKMKGEIAKALKKEILPLLAKKKLKPVIHKTFDITHAQEALDYLEAGQHIGKIVLKF